MINVRAGGMGLKGMLEGAGEGERSLRPSLVGPGHRSPPSLQLIF